MSSSRRSKILNSAISTLIMFVMVFYYVPTIVYAIEEIIAIETNEEKSIEEVTDSQPLHTYWPNIQEEEEKVLIVGELEEKRGVTEKHFLLENGNNVVAVYPSNIHYQLDGKWMDVDNTLIQKIDRNEKFKKVEKTVIVEEQIEEKIVIDEDEEIAVDIEEENGVIDEEVLEESNVQREKVFDEKLENNTSSKPIITRTDSQIALEEKLELLEKSKETMVYENNLSSSKVTFTNKTKGYNLGSITSNGYTISWGLRDSKSSEVKITNPEKNTDIKHAKSVDEIIIKQVTSAIEYKNILSYVDLSYVVEPELIKEYIMLNNREAIKNEIVFEYDTQGLKMKLTDTNDIIVYDETEDNIIFTIEAPFMYDAKLEFSGDIEVLLEEQENGSYLLTLIPNKEWLEAEERNYPVTIDPTIFTSLYWSSIYDTHIWPGDQNNMTRGNAHIVRVGNGWNSPSRGLIKFDLPALSSGDQVVWANLSICSYPKTTEWTPPTRQIQIAAHRMTADWGEHTATWNNSNSNYNTRVEDYAKYQFDYNNQIIQYNFNVTGVVKDWYTTGNNYGVMLKETNDSVNYPGNEAYFVSSDTHVSWYYARPMIQIEYRNQSGLLDYMSYHTVDVGRAGTVYTNDYNGNLTLIHPDASTPGSRMPASVYHVYNTNDRSSSFGYGNGFRLNLSQTISLVDITTYTGAIQSYARYRDEGGTLHYFKKEGATSVYKHEDVPEWKLTLANNQFTMEDKSGIKKTFMRHPTVEQWHLKEIHDTDGNKIIIDIGYNAAGNWLVTKVTDGAGDVINITYANNMLQSITDTSGRTTTYTYNNNNLIQITYPDGKSSHYSYSTLTPLLTSVKNIDGLRIDYSYYLAHVARVSGITEYSTANGLGKSLSITYGDNLTKFTDNQGCTQNINFNNLGQAISIADFGKGSPDLKQAYGKNYEYGIAGGSKNKLTLDGRLEKPVDNLTLNNSFEDSTYWTFLNWGASNVSIGYTTEQKYSGNRAIKMTSINTNVNGLAYEYNTLEKGKTYTLSAYVKTDNVVSTSNQGAYVYIIYTDGNGQGVHVKSNYISGTQDWQRVSATFTIPSNATTAGVSCLLGLEGATGIAYWDAVQLEEGTVANPYNLVENSGFDYGMTKWVTNAWNSVTDGVINQSNNNMLFINGDTNQCKYAMQSIPTSGQPGDIYNVSAWIKNHGVPHGGNNWFEKAARLYVEFRGPNNQGQSMSIDINSDSSGWQYISKEIMANINYTEINIYLIFYQNANYIYFDNIGLYKDETGNSFSYDAKGNLISSKDLAQQNSAFQYDGNNNLTKVTNPRGGSFTYTYDTTYKHRLTKAVSSLGLNYDFGYNAFGQNTSIKTTGNGLEYIENKATFSTNGRYLETLEDQRGNITTYTTNSTTGTVSKITDANQTETNYAYDTLGRLVNISKRSGSINEPDGKNLFNQSWEQGTISSTTGLPTINATRIRTINYNEIQPSTEYTFDVECLKGTDDNPFVVFEYDSNYNFLKGSGWQSLPYTFTTLNNTAYYKLVFKISENINAMPEDFKNVQRWEQGTIASATGQPNPETTRIRTVSYNEIQSSTQYTLSATCPSGTISSPIIVFEYDKNYNFLKTSSWQSLPYTFTTLNNTSYYKLVFKINDGINVLPGDITNVQLEKGSIATTYEQFIPKESTISALNSYTYNNDRLNTINHNNTTYSFVYDNFGNPTTTKVGNQTLMTNNYAANNGNLTSTVFANNQTISYAYDRFNRITQTTLSNSTINYTYDARSNLARVVDNVNNTTETYTYDLANRLTKASNTNGFLTSYTYDQNSVINTVKYVLGTQINTTTYNFSKENRLSSVNIGTNRIIQFNYDGLSRITSQVLTSGANTYTTAYTYQNTSTANKTTTMIESITNGNKQLNYTYDVLGNIETISSGNVLKQRYYYDSLNQLIREDNVILNKTISYSYDLRRQYNIKKRICLHTSSRLDKCDSNEYN